MARGDARMQFVISGLSRKVRVSGDPLIDVNDMSERKGGGTPRTAMRGSGRP